MNWKILISILATGIVAFGLGWYLNDVKRSESNKGKNQLKGEKATFNLDEHDPNEMEVNNYNDKLENFASKISGRFILKDANFAGFNFISSNRVVWTNEFGNGIIKDTLKIRWLDNRTFFTQDIIQRYNGPPRVSIYQVISFDGRQLKLKDIWTGWNNNNIDELDDQLDFIKQDSR